MTEYFEGRIPEKMLQENADKTALLELIDDSIEILERSLDATWGVQKRTSIEENLNEWKKVREYVLHHRQFDIEIMETSIKIGPYDLEIVSN